MAITNHERVGKALELLKTGMAPFVEREFQNAYKSDAKSQAESLLGEDGLPDILKIDPVIYAPENRTYHGIGKILGKAFSMGKNLK